MKIKVTFEHMDHSHLLEGHAFQKLKKLEELLLKEQEREPHYIELWFKAHKLRADHQIEIHLKTPLFDLFAQEEGADMYVILDKVIDTMIRLYKKHKEKMLDSYHKDNKRTIK